MIPHSDNGNGNGNGNGRLRWLNKDTYVPWGFALAFGGLAWAGATRLGEITQTIQNNAAIAEKTAQGVAEKVTASDQRRELDFQAIKFRLDSQGERIERIEKAVDALSHKDSK